MALAARADIPSPHPDPVVTNPPNLQFHLTFYDRQALPPHTVFSRAYSLRGPAEPGRLLPGMRVVTDCSAQIYYGSDGPGYRQATLIDAQTGLANDILFTPIPEDLGCPGSMSRHSRRLHRERAGLQPATAGSLR